MNIERTASIAAKKIKNLAQHTHLKHKKAVNEPKKNLKNSDIVLYVENLTVSFDGFKALNDLTFYLNSGELRCFIGPNGAGKSTMMDVLTGKTKVDSGSAWFVPDVKDKNPRNMLNLLEMDEVSIANAGIGRKFQKPSVFETISVAQNLELALRCKRNILSAYRAKLDSEQSDFLLSTLERIKLSDKANDLASSLSHGQKQWLEIGMLLMQKPSLIMLDEPVAGMTPEEIDMTIDLLYELEGENTIMVIEHDMDFIRAIANQVVVLNQGTVLAEGDMDCIQSNPKVIEAYLGEGL
ncbi:urea ABC transporter ATP-binding protein UrtD [Succinivibrio dextrinosolvens]|uniref:Urea transport system ATP-binding protein n=2 Tax=Succinivibrio dextrinosolvens TaxID=83771 RepID=A0A662ZBG5_9GAMM|nr:urea ABC transporter ATP-binding protein UrtD [Succinivibrio dextrinosolvens]SFK13172.1 urea transport system ATP-binding protein [Succinivibrio dextrinosolvens]